MRYFSKLIATISVAAVFSINAEAGLLSKTLDATYYHPDLSTPYTEAAFAPHPFVVAAGIETIGKVEGVTSLLTDFSDNQLTITFDTVLDKPIWNTALFNGVVFTLQSPGSLDIAAALVDPATTLSGFDNGRLSFTNLSLGLNWSGLSYSDGQKIVVNFSFNTTPVPEPASYGFLVAGLGFIGFLKRRKWQG
ncbi:MAG: PEP-CTERM sorting domain-containing protein [Betaproteobacteria bacterium]